MHDPRWVRHTGRQARPTVTQHDGTAYRLVLSDERLGRDLAEPDEHVQVAPCHGRMGHPIALPPPKLWEASASPSHVRIWLSKKHALGRPGPLTHVVINGVQVVAPGGQVLQHVQVAAHRRRMAQPDPALRHQECMQCLCQANGPTMGREGLGKAPCMPG